MLIISIKCLPTHRSKTSASVPSTMVYCISGRFGSERDKGRTVFVRLKVEAGGGIGGLTSCSFFKFSIEFFY